MRNEVNIMENQVMYGNEVKKYPPKEEKHKISATYLARVSLQTDNVCPQKMQ